MSGRYVPDLAHYREYAAAGEASLLDDPVPYRRYLERYVYLAGGHAAYLHAIGAQCLDAFRMSWA